MNSNLSSRQISQLLRQGCTAEDWSLLTIDENLDVSHIRNCTFLGEVSIGNLSGQIRDTYGIDKPCGLYNATIINCRIGNGVRVANVSVHISNYDIKDNVCIEDVGTMQTNQGATFGNGVAVEALNEAGGREVIIFDELNAQFAYLMCLHRYRPKMIEKLKQIVDRYVQKIKTDQGVVNSGANIRSVTEMVDVKVGPSAVINGAASLINGTILSEANMPTKIGTGVIAHDFIISENSSVTGQAVLDKTFIGQGCLIGEQFSAKDSLFFANCEGFHGEACSIFAGPYTVSHHKSTLLIAGLMSFYNAGSGTNQSNHMYKLGPVHEGKLLRGTKTGSFSYMMWPCRTGPFSVVLGKHTGNFDVEDFPFSHLEARADGKANFVPGLHLTTVGVVRDSAKWPKRDRRKSKNRRDIIDFDVFSPYTVGKMLKANTELKNLQKTTEKSVEEVSIRGAMIKRPLLRSCQKYYRTGIELYLLERVIEKLEQHIGTTDDFGEIFACESDALYSEKWVDIGGQLMGQKRLKQLQEEIESDVISTVEQFHKRIEQIQAGYHKDQWVWVKNKYKEYFDLELDEMHKGQVVEAIDQYLSVRRKFLNLVIADAQKEFAELSQTGFGQDGLARDEREDFIQIRGNYEENPFVKEINQSIKRLNQRVEGLKRRFIDEP